METLRYILLANVLLAVVSTAYFVLLRRKTFFGANRLALWLGLIAAVTFPLMELPVGIAIGPVTNVAFLLQVTYNRRDCVVVKRRVRKLRNHIFYIALFHFPEHLHYFFFFRR